MFALLVLSFLTSIFIVYYLLPAIWLHIISVDDSVDAHQAGVTLVASRNPFRESGPPANMAKLILLRHKIQTVNKRRRSSSPSRSPSHSRQVSRTFISNNANRGKAPWIRVSKGLGAKQSH
ncbi:hypothetical protein Agabi119p4_4693 [Agaricus bisporus var. burnettii]|uniref:Uncharacterized protein n=1 Tax=Agaricus bisporus var. burnettii TaxID=192524 RepID=A0A8H7F3M6_AGABI|nr:hypothetical protein Agabi119p4_4693 [Agaricus bisporus var. burnettii]